MRHIQKIEELRGKLQQAFEEERSSEQIVAISQELDQHILLHMQAHFPTARNAKKREIAISRNPRA